jgi:hypothetical protein
MLSGRHTGSTDPYMEVEGGCRYIRSIFLSERASRYRLRFGVPKDILEYMAGNAVRIQ